LALFGYEGLIIAIILITLFLWGPSKIPEMARVVGQAKKEFDKAAKEFTSLTDVSITNPITDSVNKTVTSPPTTTPENSRQATTPPPQDPIITAAKSLGIDTLGKTKEELATEIVAKTAK
jgi:sec-independent protein translocase protein TatA